MSESVEVSERPQNTKELADLIESFTVFDYADPGDGYQQAADAMWKAAEAAFEYVARKIGATGFQASWAALQFYGKVEHITGPYMVTRLENALYPQYDLQGSLQKFIEEQRPWLAQQARERLRDRRHASERVLAHWEELAAQA